MIEVIPVPAFADNYLWLLKQGHSNQMAVVDPGDAEAILIALEKTSATLESIIITHHHHDHIGGVNELLTHFPDAHVYAPNDERIVGATQLVEEGDQVHIACLACDFLVLEVPGHTSTHIAYYGDGKLFCGDTLFACGCGRLFEGTPQQMYSSLNKIMELPSATEIYCGHEYTLKNIAFAKEVEPDNVALLQREREARQLREQGYSTVPSLLALEKQTNPFLRSDIPTVIAAAEHRAGHSLTSGAEVFRVIRSWKDKM